MRVRVARTGDARERDPRVGHVPGAVAMNPVLLVLGVAHGAARQHALRRHVRRRRGDDLLGAARRDASDGRGRAAAVCARVQRRADRFVRGRRRGRRGARRGASRRSAPSSGLSSGFASSAGVMMIARRPLRRGLGRERFAGLERAGEPLWRRVAPLARRLVPVRVAAARARPRAALGVDAVRARLRGARRGRRRRIGARRRGDDGGLRGRHPAHADGHGLGRSFHRPGRTRAGGAKGGGSCNRRLWRRPDGWSGSSPSGRPVGRPTDVLCGPCRAAEPVKVAVDTRIRIQSTVPSP